MKLGYMQIVILGTAAYCAAAVPFVFLVSFFSDIDGHVLLLH